MCWVRMKTRSLVIVLGYQGRWLSFSWMKISCSSDGPVIWRRKVCPSFTKRLLSAITRSLKYTTTTTDNNNGQVHLHSPCWALCIHQLIYGGRCFQCLLSFQMRAQTQKLISLHRSTQLVSGGARIWTPIWLQEYWWLNKPEKNTPTVVADSTKRNGIWSSRLFITRECWLVPDSQGAKSPC